MKLTGCALSAVLLCAALSACGGGGSGTTEAGNAPASNAPFWAQWGANPQHAGMVNVAGQSATAKLAEIIYDPFVAQEQTAFGGDLVAHYQATITDGNDVYMVAKTGQYTSCPSATPQSWTQGDACGPNAWDSMVWNEQRYMWQNGSLNLIWTFTTDWKPEPNGTNFNMGFQGLQGWEPVFHPVDANNFIYVPGANGSVWKVDKTSGKSTTQIMPQFAGLSANVATAYVAGPLTADPNGNVYYNVIALADQVGPWDAVDAAGAWLVKITSSDVASTLSYQTMVTSAPAGTAMTCPGVFTDTTTLPWPPSASATPAPVLCGSQRPGVNIAPAVGPDGTIYTASRAHFDEQVSYVVAVNANFSGANWVASLQNLLSDGCGTQVPIAGPGVTTLANSCRNGTTPGVDPTTNAKGSGMIPDEASSSPTVLPDGVAFGTLDNYNYSRGHLFKFDVQGNFVGAFTFGWDSTPGVYVHGGTYSMVIKDNHYGSPAYCFVSNAVCQATAPGPYYITQLDSNLNIEWQFQSTNIQQPNNPNGFEWCINMPAIDMNGNVFVNSEDGNIYVLPQGNNGVFTQPSGKLFLNLALGAAYTPLSIGPDGKLYTQNDGILFVVGN